MEFMSFETRNLNQNGLKSRNTCKTEVEKVLKVEGIPAGMHKMQIMTNNRINLWLHLQTLQFHHQGALGVLQGH